MEDENKAGLQDLRRYNEQVQEIPHAILCVCEKTEAMGSHSQEHFGQEEGGE
jgi:hypothetical protein